MAEWMYIEHPRPAITMPSKETCFRAGLLYGLQSTGTVTFSCLGPDLSVWSYTCREERRTRFCRGGQQ